MKIEFIADTIEVARVPVAGGSIHDDLVLLTIITADCEMPRRLTLDAARVLAQTILDTVKEIENS